MCATSATLTINSNAVPWVGFEVEANHPDRASVQKRASTWELKLGLLPWQGFNVRSFVKPGSADRATPAAGIAVLKVPETRQLTEKTDGA
jgi:hypothetical protein